MTDKKMIDWVRSVWEFDENGSGWYIPLRFGSQLEQYTTRQIAILQGADYLGYEYVLRLDESLDPPEEVWDYKHSSQGDKMRIIGKVFFFSWEGYRWVLSHI